MNNAGRVSALAVLLVIALRLSIGWQLLYEGLWKIKTHNSPTPWTSEGYLKNSVGPMRGQFRAMTGDPNDLDWLDAEKVAANWDQWRQRFETHYKLTDNQKRRLAELLEGPSEFAAELQSLPDGISLDTIKNRDRKNAEVQVIHYDAAKKRLVVNGQTHLLPREYQEIRDHALASESADTTEFVKALDAVYQRSTRLSYKERARASLGADAAVGNAKQQRMGEIQKYKVMLTEYEATLAQAKQAFHYDHLAKLWKDIQAQRASLVNPIKALDSDLKTDAVKLLSVEQVRMGGVPEAWTPLRITDVLTIAGLTILGFLLIVGLFTRLSAVVAAFMLFSFYMAMPPLPGLPDPPGTEHSLIVNKNLIEVVALLAIAALPTGWWFGLDRLLGHLLWSRKRGSEKPVGKVAARA